MFSIQKMPATAKDTGNYFRYFAPPSEMRTWGLSVTAAGFTRIPPGVQYPMSAHPENHALDWARGRILDTLQIVLIAEGRGHFETRRTGLLKIAPGTAFALLPGVWHRYRPDAQTGWVESWVEVRGPLVDRLIARKVVDAARATRANATATEMETALQRVHARSRKNAALFDPARAAAAYAVLAAWEQAGRMTTVSRSRLDQSIEKLEHLFAERYAESLDMEQLSKKMGVAYSHLRHAFKQHTGYAPWQYVINLRMAHARRLLVSTDATLDEIAGQTGFNTGFHLSAKFKQMHGMSPTAWRRNLETQNKAGPGR